MQQVLRCCSQAVKRQLEKGVCSTLCSAVSPGGVGGLADELLADEFDEELDLDQTSASLFSEGCDGVGIGALSSVPTSTLSG